MSQHSSLRIDPTRTRHRNVLKRHERVQRLIEQEKWTTDRTSAFGLPKVKSVKIKVKKVKAEKAEGATTAAAAPGTTAAPAAQSTAEKKKPAAGEKKSSDNPKK